ncbi:hypothetical protein GW17_00037540, partial [Ensete ventricosum]
LADLHRPPSPDPFPVIIFFHGGSFAHSSSNTAIYDSLCRRFVSLCGAVVISVDYRRSPEHRYPCAYDDGWAALKWASGEPWLHSGKDAKLRVFLCGDSSGGNIAHHVAVKAAESGIEVSGNILLNPMFGGNHRTESERRLDGKYFVTIQDRDWYWKAYLPEGANRDHPACNPFGPNGMKLEELPFTKSLVIVAGLDLVQDWQLAYTEGLKKAGKDVKLVYREQATIGFYLLPNTDHFYEVMEEIKNFVTSWPPLKPLKAVHEHCIKETARSTRPLPTHHAPTRWLRDPLSLPVAAPVRRAGKSVDGDAKGLEVYRRVPQSRARIAERTARINRTRNLAGPASTTDVERHYARDRPWPASRPTATAAGH